MTDEYIKDKSGLFIRIERLESDEKESMQKLIKLSEALTILSERQDRDRGDIEVIKAWVQNEHKIRREQNPERTPIIKKDQRWIAVASIIASIITTTGIILVALIQGYFTLGSGK